MKTSKRTVSFWNSELPLTSKRVRAILSAPIEAKKMMVAIRDSRKNGYSSESSTIDFSTGFAEKLYNITE